MKNKTALLVFMFATAIILGACSTSKKTAETTKITGANQIAGVSDAAANTNIPNTNAKNTPRKEISRSENFTLAEGEDTDNIGMTKNYHVVVGSFQSRSNAQGLKSTLDTEGYDAIVVINQNGMYRVIISSFDTYKEARNCINSMQERFPDAWVLVKVQ